MALINLVTNNFEPVPVGETSLKIVSASVLPPAVPQYIELKFKDHMGRNMSSTYQLTNDTSMFIFSKIVRDLLGDRQSIDSSEVAELVGKYLKVRVKHVEKQSNKDPEKMLVFANIDRVLGKGEPFDTEPQVSYDAATGEILNDDLPSYDDLSDL